MVCDSLSFGKCSLNDTQPTAISGLASAADAPPAEHDQLTRRAGVTIDREHFQHPPAEHDQLTHLRRM